jgi:hypothetical protein
LHALPIYPSFRRAKTARRPAHALAAVYDLVARHSVGTLSEEISVLTASMLDGFGWFPEERYRRTLLLFDNIRYVLPDYVSGLMAPPWVYGRPDFEPVEHRSDSSDVRERLERAELGARDVGFQQAFEAVPDDDAAYALRVVAADRELRFDSRSLVEEPIVAVSYLAEKLLDHCHVSGSIPVVGQDYASRILAFKSAQRLGGPPSSGDILTGQQATALHTVAAGLSYTFVSDADLLATSPERILQYKTSNRELLERHQMHLVSVAQRFAELSSDDGRFATEMVALRQQALSDRMTMEHDAWQAWRSAGLQLAQKSLLVAGGGLITALGLIGTRSLLEVAASALPAMVGATAFAAVEGLKARETVRKVRTVAVSYLVGASEGLHAPTHTSP